MNATVGGVALPSVTRRKKPLKPGAREHLSVSVPAELLMQLDAAAERLTKEQGYTVRRSDVVIKAVREWLSSHGAK